MRGNFFFYLFTFIGSILPNPNTKLMIAKNVLVRHFEANKIDYTMNLLNLAIECAVARFKK